MDPSDHEDIVWLHTQLTGQANGLSGIYERIAYTIRELQDDKAALQNRIEELEQGDPSAEVRRLREENSILRARLATSAKEKSEITWERDALLRKLNGIKQLVDGPAFDAINVSTDAPKAEPGPGRVSSTVRPKDDPHDHPRTVTQQSGSITEHTSPTHTVSSPRTDVTIAHDSFGRIIRPVRSQATSSTTTTTTSDPREASKPPSTHTSATVIDVRNRSQDTAPRSLGPAFVDARETTAALRTPPTHRLLSADSTGSPMRASPGTATRILSLSTSPRTSEGLSMQYDMTPPRFGTRTVAGDTAKMVQKWRIHFAKPPKSATVTALAKPVTTEVLVRNLELDEKARRSIEALSSEPAGSLRLYISDAPPGLAFFYDPILLESPEATYVVEWSEAKASQKSRAYITTAKEKHTELHTFMYAPRKNVWYYLGERHWSLADIKTLWDSLGPAQHVAARSSDPESISHGLERGELEQLTIELQQVSLIQPSTAESVVMKQLAQE
ncbi:hypothetical protein F5888DRAFT_1799013 [Russula emetica]|nr:hypothetical protein F5888DRAFT_1809629 [Russula emetica]KAF8506095.1 hypothetical protein F5888DRAFT_1799013 [Russula emetica]